MPNSPASPRRRGAPAGNLNAVKHGFYARQFHKADIRDLEDDQTGSLDSEIKLMRVFIRRVLESSDARLPFPQSIELLRALSLASIAINRLIRTQHLLRDPNASLLELQNALASMIEDMEKEYQAPRTLQS